MSDTVWIVTFAPDPDALTEHKRTQWWTVITTTEPSQAFKDAAYSVVEVPKNESETLDSADIPDGEEVEPRTWTYPDPPTNEPSNVTVDLVFDESGTPRNVQETLSIQFARLWGGEKRVTIVCSDIGVYSEGGDLLDLEGEGGDLLDPEGEDEGSNEAAISVLCATNSYVCRDFSTGTTYTSFNDAGTPKIRKKAVDGSTIWTATISDTDDPVDHLSWMGPGNGICGLIESIAFGGPTVVCLNPNGTLAWTFDVEPSSTLIDRGSDPDVPYTNVDISGPSADYDGNIYFLRLSWRDAGDGLNWWLLEFIRLNASGVLANAGYLDISSDQSDADEQGRVVAWRPANLICGAVPGALFGDTSDMELGFYGGGGAYGVCAYDALDTKTWVWTDTHKLCRVSAGGHASFVEDLRVVARPASPGEAAKYYAIACGPGTWGIALAYDAGDT